MQFYMIGKYFSQVGSGEPILWNSQIIESPLVYFNFKILKDSNFLSFIRFRCILHDWAVLFSVFFLKWKTEDLISWGQPILQKSNLFGPLSCISILKIWRTQILHHLLDLNSFYKIQQYFSQFFETSSFFKWKRVT